MTRSVFKGTFLIVEGATDVRLYGKFTADGVRVIAAHSKHNVQDTVKECLRRRDKGVVGIVDRDLDGMLGKRCSEPVFETDRRDMESTLMCSPALDDVLAEYGEPEQVRRFSGADGIRGKVGRAASPLGMLMYISYRKGMNLSFKDVDHSMFVNRRTLDVDVRRMVSEVYSHSMAQMYSEQLVGDLVKDMMSQTEDVWSTVRGHDAVAVLTIGLKNAFGAYNAKALNDNSVSGALRLAYTESEFTSTELFKDSRAYAEKAGLSLWKVTPAP